MTFFPQSHLLPFIAVHTLLGSFARLCGTVRLDCGRELLPIHGYVGDFQWLHPLFSGCYFKGSSGFIYPILSASNSVSVFFLSSNSFLKIGFLIIVLIYTPSRAP